MCCEEKQIQIVHVRQSAGEWRREERGRGEKQKRVDEREGKGKGGEGRGEE